jgi:hypothetical protein
MSDTGDTSGVDRHPALEIVREELFGHYRQRIAQLEAELGDLECRITDKEALIATVSPVLGDAIRRQIRDAREDMIEALYPIIGQLVVRAVSEAVQDLARKVDAQVRRSFNPRAWCWRIRARLGGASQAETSLRALLPFEVNEVFLVHRETGLLLWHSSHHPAAAQDSDLVSSMLTAIRDFAQDAFGRGKEGELEEIEYGDQRILIEGTRHAYLAVVVDGVEPPGFRATIRKHISQIEHHFGDELHHYEGDPTALAAVEEFLLPLIVNGRSPEAPGQ